MSWNTNNPSPRNFFNDPQPPNVVPNQVRPYQFMRNEPSWNTNNPAPPLNRPAPAHGLPQPSAENYKYYKTAPGNHKAVPTAASVAEFALRNERRASSRRNRRNSRRYRKNTRRSGSRR